MPGSQPQAGHVECLNSLTKRTCCLSIIIKAHGGKFCSIYCEGIAGLKSGVLRTFGSVRRRHQQFLHSGGDKKNASKHANAINEPLLNVPDETPVLDVLPPAQLHLFMGATNSPIDLLIKVYGADQVEKWLGEIHVIRHGYHGGSMDGNNCNRLLDNLDQFAQQLPPETALIIAVLRALRELAKGIIYD